jgi:hypothetical protein
MVLALSPGPAHLTERKTKKKEQEKWQLQLGILL